MDDKWLWILRHEALIRSIAYKVLGQNSGIDPLDMQSELRVRIAEKWHQYDDKRSAPPTWIWWQARATKELLVRRKKANAAEPTFVSHECLSYLSVRPTQEASATAEQIKKHATPDEWTAACAVGAGFGGKLLGEVCGCSRYGAQKRVLRLRERLSHG